MKHKKLLLAACCAVLWSESQAYAQPAVPAKPKADLGKRVIEFGPKRLIAESAPAPRPVVVDANNPWVEPGKVRWHDSFEKARKAAANTGKPVLLFQMMGRLDQQFT